MPVIRTTQQLQQLLLRQQTSHQRTAIPVCVVRLFPHIFFRAAAAPSKFLPCSSYLHSPPLQRAMPWPSLFTLPPSIRHLCMYNAAVDWSRDAEGGVGAFLERVICPVIKAGCVRVQLIICSDDVDAAMCAVLKCLEGGGLTDWAKERGNVVNAMQLCSSGCFRTCPYCSAIPSHHLDFALLSRCHWALVSNSTFGTASRM